VGAIVFQ